MSVILSENSRASESSQWQGCGAGLTLPAHDGLYYGGAWHAPRSGRYGDVYSPGDGSRIGRVAVGDASDVDAAVAAARQGFAVWRDTPPLERARILRAAAVEMRKHAADLALLDAADCGNPVAEMTGDVMVAAALFEFFAGLVTEMKGASIPMGPEAINFTVREPVGVVARIVAFNHPFMFAAGKMAAPLAAGNAVIVKPPEQAPLSSLRLAEIVGGLFPPGVVSILNGGRDVGESLVSHPDVAMLGLVGSVPTGRAVARGAAERIKPMLLELGGKNALIAYPDVDPDALAAGAVAGMNFTWCGQSCGSTSRLFLHASLYDAVVERIAERCKAFVPGLPTDPKTSMGAVISQAQHARVLAFIASAHEEGARLVYGGKVPDDPALANGYYIEPTVFADVQPQMRIAREEIFGPVLSIIKWHDEAQMLADVNALDYGLTCAIWTNDLEKGMRTASRVNAGFVWINEVGKHFLGAPFGGMKQSGMGREECLGEMLSFTQEKNIHVSLRRVATQR
ncbi:betaine aldehyde dehydrogenase (BADH) protein [Pandoraea horticolens]|uniref:Betaine aldehyde dehydrogenase (BADH) protein n=1 Tax=Pandoraea horticolens TaxID=2508298 RepID=A0A5E4VQF0_9BURK|nr:aldehyde dehydrogenase family protein [Pandoraea horticolens]VVE13235.1 betaine aldehyde dehydrogenase (BADH) protein [Pandoraea horticolens]